MDYTDENYLMVSNPTPPGWGNDAFSHFSLIAHHNELATFVHQAAWEALIAAITADLVKCSTYAITSVLKADDPSARLLFMTSHNHFLASARLATSGQCLPAYATGRAAMESALYGWYLAGTPGAGKRWHDKPKGHKESKGWNQEFKFSSINKKLGERRAGLDVWAKHLHQTAIDFGAHPNKEALYSNMSTERLSDGNSLMQMRFLHEWSSLAVGTTKFVLETGMFSLCLFSLAFPEAAQEMGLNASAGRHAEALHALIANSAAIMEGDAYSA